MALNPALAAKIANAKASVGGNMIKDGSYLLEVRKILVEQKRKGNTFIVEFKVIEAIASGEVEADGRPVIPNAVGSGCSYVLNLDTNDSAAGNAKSFVLGLLGFNEADVSTEEFIATLGELADTPQPGTGMLIRDKTYRRPIQKGPNAGKPFVGHNWEHVAQLPEEIAARKAA